MDIVLNSKICKAIFTVEYSMKSIEWLPLGDFKDQLRAQCVCQ